MRPAADSRAEVHEGLVPSVGVGRKGGCGQRQDGLVRSGLGIGVADKTAGEDAADVGVEEGDALPEGEAGDGAGGIWADAFELQQLLHGVGEGAAEAFHHLLRDLVEADCPQVVAKRRPAPDDLAPGRRRQRRGGRERAEELVVLGEDALHLGLLEHDLGDQNGVGVVGMAPGEIAALPGVPVKQPALDKGDDVRRRQGRGYRGAP